MFLLFIIGTTHNGSQAISYDSDNDENFEGEKILYFPINIESKEKQRHILDTLGYQRAEFEYFNGNELENRTKFIVTEKNDTFPNFKSHPLLTCW